MKLRELLSCPPHPYSVHLLLLTSCSDLVDKKAKTGIAHRALKPMLGICDPLNTRTMPSAVAAATGLDVLCHALESYTAIPFNERIPRPANPILRFISLSLPPAAAANSHADLPTRAPILSVTCSPSEPYR